MRPLETSLSRRHQVAFSVGQEEENEFAVPGEPLEISLFRPQQSRFLLVKWQKMVFKCHSTARIAALST